MIQVNLLWVLIGVLGTQEIVIILIIILLLFGGRKIPELMKGLGRGVREFNDAKNNVRKEIEEGLNEQPPRNTDSNNSASASTTSAAK